jgi:hypothetical protein
MDTYIPFDVLMINSKLDNRFTKNVLHDFSCPIGLDIHLFILLVQIYHCRYKITIPSKR